MKRREVELVTDLGPDLPECNLDQDLFYRAILNILVNALQALPDKGGYIQVTTRRGSDSFVELSIQDSGVGIPEDKLGNIFQPFFTDKHKGTGLGLAIVKNILDGHRAVIRVESTLGHGTTFIITIPAI